MEFTGTANPINSLGDGPFLYAVVRPAGGIGCQSSFGNDQASAGGATFAVLAGDLDPGPIAQQMTVNTSGVGSYLICAWLEDVPDSSSHPDPPIDVTAGPVTAVFSTPGPQVREFDVALAGPARPGIAYSIKYTTQIDQQLRLDSVIKPADGLPCASSFELEQSQNQSERDVADNTTVLAGRTTISATDTEQKAGPYVICSWIEGPNAGEVDAISKAVFYVDTPRGRPPAPPCTVPRFHGSSLSTVERRIMGHHCAIGHIRYAYNRVRRGTVLALSAKARAHLGHRARIAIVVSAGPKPNRIARRFAGRMGVVTVDSASLLYRDDGTS